MSALAIALLLPIHALVGVAVMAMSQPRLQWSLDPLLAAQLLDDQRLGGALMWLAGDAVATVWLGALLARWFARTAAA